ncbi:hypothetical protein K474DRAFT_1595764 [Panus rudis PR-1116 ss-1]|nr:hypothetical protein K474DRAFT_1595764 [Panus rudis PR-1116 ss-1]
MSNPLTDPQPAKERSVSRGRDHFHSSGRGGAGNIRRSSQSKGPASPVINGREPEVAPPPRGRDVTVEPEKSQAVGRGGIGNIRSTSRARAASQAPDGFPQTAYILNDNAQAQAEYERTHVSGRGGMGNIKSRSRSRGPAIHSTGRGGVGNLQPGPPQSAENAEILDEIERLRIAHEDGLHSTGRGGIANITSAHSPPPEEISRHSPTYEAMGRGGIGNIRSRSASRDPDGRSPSKDRHGLARLWGKVSRSQSRDVDDVGHKAYADSETASVSTTTIQE